MNLPRKLKSVLSFGVIGDDFDRIKFVNETFCPNDMSLVEDDPVAIQLKALNIRHSMYMEERAISGWRKI